MAYLLLIALAAVVGMTAYFLQLPPPPLSKGLSEWKERGQMFKIGSQEIFYINEKGTGSSGVVVCLHGFPTSSYDWIKILVDMKKEFSQVILLDFLGYGFSNKPVDHIYTIGGQADIVEGLVGQLQIKWAHILSHDYGDTVALELLARFNEKTLSFQMKSLMMLNGGIFSETHYPRLSQKALLTPGVGFLMSHLFSYPFFRKGFNEVFGVEPSENDFQDFWAAIRHNNGDRAMYKIINFLRERQTFKERWVGALVSTQIKVLMIYGPADPVNPPAFAARFREKAPKQSIVVLSTKIGHYPQWEEPAAVSTAIVDFVRQMS